MFIPSPFAPRVGTNYCPSSEEISIIKSLLVEPSLRLIALDEEIAILQRALDKLRAERETVSAYVDAHEALISPVRRLPLDILQAIFEACIPTHRNCLMSAIEAPLLLGRVCSAWRTVAFRAPRLWCRLNLFVPGLPYCPSPTLVAAYPAQLAQRFEAAKTWLSRAGRCPLSVSFEQLLDHTEYRNNGLLQVLIPFVSQWEHMSFGGDPIILAALADLDPRAAPRLKSLEVSEKLSLDSKRGQWASSSLLCASTVSRFSLEGAFKGLELPIQWDSLVELFLNQTRSGSAHNEGLTTDNALRILSRCSKLQLCSLRLDDPPDSDAEADTFVFHHPCLQTLEVYCVHSLPSTCRQLCSRLLLPQLRHFTCLGQSYEVNGDIRIVGFFAAAERLESVSASPDLFSTAQSIAEFFQLAPTSLCKFHLVCSARHSSSSNRDPTAMWNNALLATLTPKSSGPAAAPGLAELSLRHAHAFSDKALLEFIRGRTAPGTHAKLERIWVDFSREQEYDILPELCELRKQGFDVKLNYPPPLALKLYSWQGM